MKGLLEQIREQEERCHRTRLRFIRQQIVLGELRTKLGVCPYCGLEPCNCPCEECEWPGDQCVCGTQSNRDS